jgi:hypothetical protein
VSVGLVENATCAILAAMTKLELLEQELATLQAEENTPALAA